jgi:hypothetical protein
MDISQNFQEIAVLSDNYCFVSTAKQLSIYPVKPVKALRIHPIDMTHTTGKVAVRSLDQQVVVIGHQAICRHPEIPLLRRFLKNTYKQIIVMAGEENVFSPSATVHNIIPGSRILYA